MPTIYRATIHSTWFSARYNNVLHFVDQVGQGSPPPSTQLLAEDLVTNWLEAERQFHQASYQFRSVTVSEIRNPAPMPSHIALTTKVGSGSTQGHSASCIKFRWLTNRGGRKGFGKYYLGGLNWALIGNANTLSTSTVTSLTAFLAGIEGRYQNGDQNPVPFHQVLLHKNPADGFEFIHGSSIYPVLGVQRRRTVATSS